ncbi:MAG: UDP-glucose 4-epimerase [Candidatus Thorarchaeota archaeon AB_25]|nr:MAG: UDP-glucose 4-epimerase [Candidatus Thorarchaeota archaeon AB_25]
MSRNAIVTGAAGFIGSHLVDLLLENEFSVIGIDNMRTGNIQNLAGPLKNGNFQLLKEDICNQKFPDIVKEDVDVIFHLAAISSVKVSVEDPILVNDTNVRGTINVLEMARKRNAKKIVLSSSAAVYGNPDSLPVREDTPLDPLSPYAASKISAEMYCISYGKLYGITPVIFRYFNVNGPRQEDSEYSGVIPIFINQGLQNKDITIEGDGSQTRSFIYVEDVAKATYLGSQLESDSGHILNLSGSDSISILELARMVKELVPDSTSTIVHRSAREGDVKDSIGSMERTSDVLGFSPTVPFKTGLDRTVSWYRLHQD